MESANDGSLKALALATDSNFERTRDCCALKSGGGASCRASFPYNYSRTYVRTWTSANATLTALTDHDPRQELVGKLRWFDINFYASLVTVATLLNSQMRRHRKLREIGSLRPCSSVLAALETLQPRSLGFLYRVVSSTPHLTIIPRPMDSNPTVSFVFYAHICAYVYVRYGARASCTCARPAYGLRDCLVERRVETEADLSHSR